MKVESRSQQLLDKVYDHLETIDVTKLSMDELKDFLEVVQKGQFLESFGGFGSALSPSAFGSFANTTREQREFNFTTPMEDDLGAFDPNDA